MSFLLLFCYLFLFLWLIGRLNFFRQTGIDTNRLRFFFLLKVAAGTALWALYTFYYPDRSTADIWKYFDDSAVLHRALTESPAAYFRLMTGIGDDAPVCTVYRETMLHWDRSFDSFLFNDSHSIIRFNAFVRIFSFGNFHIHTLFMCMLSFIGLCGLYRAFRTLLAEWKTWLMWLIFLFPSVLFWGSGVLKEGLLLFGFGVLIDQAVRWVNDRKKIRLLWIFLSGLLVFVAKFYVLAAAFPALLIWILTLNYGWSVWRISFVVVLLYVGGGVGLRYVSSTDPLQVIATKQNDFIALASGGTYLYNDTAVFLVEQSHHEQLSFTSKHDSVLIPSGIALKYWNISTDFKDTLTATSTTPIVGKVMTDNPRAGSLMAVVPLQATLISFVYESPKAFLRALLRPWPWEARNPLLLFPLFENGLCLFLFVLALLFPLRNSQRTAAFAFCLVFAVLLLLISGLTTPVLGALVRYRMLALLLLAVGLLLKIDREKMVQRWSFLKRLKP